MAINWTIFSLIFLIAKLNGDICITSICRYEFIVRESRSMMYAVNFPNGWQDVYDVALNGSQLNLKPNGFHEKVPGIKHDELLNNTNTLDGVAAPIIVINDRFPGPTIEVMEGAQVVVNVINSLQKQTLTIHWHGMHQRSTFYSDGVPYITQCPIAPGQSFTYRFFANPAGTHWYHSHVLNQKVDGLYGAVVVHRHQPTIPSHVLVLSDWYQRTSTELEVLNPYRTYDRGTGHFHYKTIDRDHSFDGVKLSAISYISGLINGRGRFEDKKAPLSVFKVKQGSKYRLHLVGALAEYAYRFSIDNHTLTVVESDGYSIDPLEVQSLIIFGGETYVIEIDANQLVENYWIRAETLKDGKGPMVEKDSIPKGKVLAILRYSGVGNKGDPGISSKPLYCTKMLPCKVLNCPWEEFPESDYPHTVCIHVDDMRMSSSVKEEVDQSILSPDQKVHEIFLNFAFSFGSSVNNHRFISVKSGPVYEKENAKLTPCVEECYEKGCRCTNVIKIPGNSVIQMVFMGFVTVNDLGKNYSNKAHHPIHMHGHSFFVLKQGFGKTNDSSKRLVGLNDAVACDNKPCSRQHWRRDMSKELNYRNPPVKDTVIAPSQGYTVVRFRSDNPGFWFLHCHTMFHLNEGMAVLIEETPEELTPPPKHLPRCHSFEMNDTEFSSWMNKKPTVLKESSMTDTTIVVISIVGAIVLITTVDFFIVRWYIRKRLMIIKSTDNTEMASYKKQ